MSSVSEPNRNATAVKSTELSRDELQLLSAEYGRFSRIVLGLVSLAAGIMVFMLMLTGFPISDFGLLGFLGVPLASGAILAIGGHFGIHRRLQKLEAPTAP